MLHLREMLSLAVSSVCFVLLVSMSVDAMSAQGMGSNIETREPSGVNTSEVEALRLKRDCCEDDLFDSCDSDGQPCCRPLRCKEGKCVPRCNELGSLCVRVGERCCEYLGQFCLKREGRLLPICSQCVQPLQLCNPNVKTGFVGSCCFNYVCAPNGLGGGICVAPPRG